MGSSIVFTKAIEPLFAAGVNPKMFAIKPYTWRATGETVGQKGR